MSTWYHRASWAALKALYSKSVLENVEAVGAENLPEGPFLLLSDHSNYLDPYAVGSFSRRPIRYMANIEGVGPLKAALAGIVGAYGRRKGKTDLGALRETFALASAGDAIGIFPEGDRSWDGQSVSFRPGVGKLARLLAREHGMPLILARQKGNYLSHPRWAKRSRKGTWQISFLRFGAEEVARMSEGLVDAIVARALKKNEIKEAQLESRIFSGEGTAEGIGRLIWRCPICGKTDTVRGRGNEIGCCRCGARWELDANCRVRPVNVAESIHAAAIHDLKDWHDWQVETLPEIASIRSSAFRGLASEGVILSRRTKSGLLRIGRGRLSWRGRLRRGASGGASEAELVFESPEANIAFNANAVHGFVDNFNEFSEFDHGGERWRLEFGGGNAAKWAYALSELGECQIPETRAQG